MSSRHRSSEGGFVRRIEHSAEVIDDSVTGVTSSWASRGVRASKETRRSDNDAVPEMSSGLRSLYPVRGVVCQPEKTKQLDRIDHVGAHEGGRSVKLDQVPQDKLWSAIKSASSCFGQAEEDIALHCLNGDDLHPYGINDCDDSVSSRAR